MKKHTLIGILFAVAATVIILAITWMGSMPPESPAMPIEPPAPTEPVTPAVPETPEPPETPASSTEGEEPIVLYIPDEQAENLVEVGAESKTDAKSLIAALVESGALPDGCEAQSESTDEITGVLTLDMNAVYGNAVRSSGTAGEEMLIYTVVNTFAQARDISAVLITIDGATLESGHEVYDEPLAPLAQ